MFYNLSFYFLFPSQNQYEFHRFSKPQLNLFDIYEKDSLRYVKQKIRSILYYYQKENLNKDLYLTDMLVFDF